MQGDESIIIKGCNDAGNIVNLNYPLSNLKQKQYVVEITSYSLSFDDIATKRKHPKYEHFNRRLFGFEGTGKIVKIGDNCGSGYKLGDEVYFMANRGVGIGKYAIVNEWFTFKIPQEEESDDESAEKKESKLIDKKYYTIMRQIVMAKNLMEDMVAINPGAYIAISNPTSGVTLMMIEAIKKAKCKVCVFIDSDKQRKSLSGIKVDKIIDIRDGDDRALEAVKSVTGDGAKVDLFYDFLGGVFAKKALKFIRYKGYYLNVWDYNGITEGQNFDFQFAKKNVISCIGYDFGIMNQSKTSLENAVKRCEDLIKVGHINPRIQNYDMDLKKDKTFNKIMQMIENKQESGFISIS